MATLYATASAPPPPPPPPPPPRRLESAEQLHRLLPPPAGAERAHVRRVRAGLRAAARRRERAAVEVRPQRRRVAQRRVGAFAGTRLQGVAHCDRQLRRRAVVGGGIGGAALDHLADEPRRLRAAAARAARGDRRRVRAAVGDDAAVAHPLQELGGALPVAGVARGVERRVERDRVRRDARRQHLVEQRERLGVLARAAAAGDRVVVRVRGRCRGGGGAHRAEELDALAPAAGARARRHRRVVRVAVGPLARVLRGSGLLHELQCHLPLAARRSGR